MSPAPGRQYVDLTDTRVGALARVLVGACVAGRLMDEFGSRGFQGPGLSLTVSVSGLINVLPRSVCSVLETYISERGYDLEGDAAEAVAIRYLLMRLSDVL